MSETAVLLCGHGSREVKAIHEFEVMAATLQRRLTHRDVAAGFLEFARPTIRDSLAALAGRGARRIVVVPAMLLGGNHVSRDLPRKIAVFGADHLDIEVRLGRGLADDARLLTAAAARIAAAAPADRSDTLLLVVGRGTGAPQANAAINAIARRLQEEMGFGAADAAFAGVADPRSDAALDEVARRGHRHIVVFPYFLFGGVLVQRIYAQTAAAAARFPAVEFAKALYLRDHPAVIDALAERAAEFAGGPEPA